MTYLDPVSRAVEKANAANTVEDGVAAVLQHVVSADRRLALSLSGKDGALHDCEILFVQHLRHIWQLPTEEKARVNVKTKLTAQKKPKNQIISRFEFNKTNKISTFLQIQVYPSLMHTFIGDYLLGDICCNKLGV